MTMTFDKPSDLFRWSLLNTETGDPTFTYDVCFPLYKQAAGRDGYLWESYDRRLADLVAEVRPGMRVLEVGSGFGHDTHWAAVRGATVTGIEVNSDFVAIADRLTPAVEEAAGRSLDITIRRGNLLAMPESGAYDLIFMKDVFHHLEPRTEVVAKLADLLAPGGRIVIVEPNAWNPLIQLQMFRIRGFNTIIEKVDAATGERFVFGNERLVSGGAIRSAFAACGVHGTTRRFRLLPTALSARPSLTALARGLEAIGAERLGLPACIHCVYYGRKSA